MLDFIRSLLAFNSLESLPWRWWVSIGLGMAGMIAILMNVPTDIAVLYVFLDLVMAVVLGAAWQWRADDRKKKQAG